MARSHPSSTSRRWWLWTLGAGSLGLALLLGASWWIARQLEPLISRERVEALLSSGLGRPVSVEAVAVRAWPLGVEMTGVRVAAGPTWEAGTLLALRRARTTLGVASLWRREVVLSTIRVDGAEVRHVAQPGGEPFALPDRIPDRIDVGPVSVRLSGVALEDARLELRDPAAGWAVRAEEVAAEAVPREDGLDLTLSARDLTAETRWPGRRAPVTLALARPRVEARLRGHHATLDVEARWEGETLRAKGDVRDIDRAPVLALSVTGRLPLEPATVLAGTQLQAKGLARVHLAVSGPLSAPAVKGTAAVPDLTAGPVRAREVKTALEWSGTRLRVSEASASALGGQVSGGLALDVARPGDAQISVRARDVAIDQLETLLGRRTGLAGRLSGEADLRGDLRQPLALAGQVRVESADLVLPGDLARLGKGQAGGEARVGGGAIEVLNGRGEWAALRVERVAGRATADEALGLGATLVGDLAKLGPLWNEGRVGGSARVTAEARGRWSDLEIAGRASAAPLTLVGTRLDALELPFRLRGTTLTLREAAFVVGQSRLEATGTVKAPAGDKPLAERAAVDLALRLPAARLEDLHAFVPADWRGAGRFSLTGRLTGTLQAWRSEGRVEASALSVRGRAIERFSARFSLDRSGLEVTGLRGTLEGVLVDAALAWRWDGYGEGRATAGPLAAAGIALGDAAITASMRDGQLAASFALPDVSVTGRVAGRLAAGQTLAVHVELRDADLVPALRTLATTGPETLPTLLRVTGEADLGVPIDDPARTDGVVRLTAVRARLAGEDVENDGPVVVRRLAGRTRIESLALAGRTGRFIVAGAVADDATADLDVRGRIPLAIVPAFSAAVAEAGGVLDATARVRGRLAAPVVTGDGTVSDGRLRARAYPAWPASGWRARFTLAGDRLRVTEAAGMVAGIALEASGDVTLQRPVPRLDLRVTARLPLERLAALRPEVQEAAGTLALEVRIAGSASAPAVTGEGALGGGRLVLRDYPDPVRDVRLRLAMSPQAVRVTDFAAVVSGGTLTGRGELALRDGQLGAYRARLEARRVSPEALEGLRSTWDADLELVGSGTRAQLRGEARLLRGTYVSELPLLRMVLDRRPAAGSAGPGLPLDVRVRLDDNLLVRTTLATFPAGGTLTVRGTTAAPVVFGTVEAREGQITLRRQRFTIERGLARFDDPRRLNPALDVLARARIRTYDVTLRVRGRMDDLEVRASSVPPLPEEDVLSLVAFGQTRGQLGAGAFASELAGLILEDALGVRSPLSRVDVELQTADPGRRSVTVGAAITPQTRVLYTQGIDQADDRRLRIEYQVTGPLWVTGEQSVNGSFGGGVLVRLRFR